jgi:class 3 adenylate cyclase/tetratricopeptide (TPR) repeat protein
VKFERVFIYPAREQVPAVPPDRYDLAGTSEAAMSTTSIVTVLFTDLVQSTDALSRLGEAQAEALRQTHFALLRDAIRHASGTEVKNLGDGLMVVFNSASDAVSCAVAMQQALDRHNRRGGEPLQMRVGIALGEVTCEDDDYFGTPVVEASRLCDYALGTKILVTEMVRTLAGTRGGQRYEPRGAVELKGMPDPVAISEAIWQPVADTGLPLPPRLQVPHGIAFVGRAAQVDTLTLAWKRARQGARQLVFIGGEPGVGKTRLASETALAAHSEGATVLLGTCDEDLAVPYQPFVEALRHFIAACPEDQLVSRLGDRRSELARLAPELPHRVPGLSPPQPADPDTERYLMFEAVAGWLVAASPDRPVVLLLDDLHWATKPTMLMLKHIVRFAGSMALLVIGTYRDSDLSRNHPLTELLADLRRETGVERLGLRGLGDSEALSLVEALAGHELSGDNLAMAQAVHAETDGNPFFMREILENMIESGALVQEDSRWTYRGDTTAFDIPESLREVIGRRLSRLSEEVERLLTLAAVIGTKFDLAVLTGVARVPQAAAVEALEQAAAARLVREVAGSAGRFTFANALIRDVLYEELSSARRMALHRSVGVSLEELAGGRPDAYLAELAHHWLAATPEVGVVTADALKAAEYAEKAGRQAMASLAYEEAVQHFGGALRAISLTDDRSRRCELYISLGEAQRCAGDPAYRETLLAAGQLAMDLGDAERCARAALTNERGIFSMYGQVDLERAKALDDALRLIGPEDTATRARLLASLASELHFSNEARRHDLGREALEVARRLDDQVTLARILAATWFGTWDPDTFAERVGLAQELTELAHRLGDRLLEFHAGAATFLTATQQGDMPRADAGLEACARAAEQLGQPALRWRAAYSQTNRDLGAGRLAKVEAELPASDQLGAAGAARDYPLFTRLPLAVTRLLQGRPEEARDVLAALVKDFPGLPLIDAPLGWAAAEAGRFDEARRTLDFFAKDGFAGISRNYAFMPTIAFLCRLAARLADQAAAAQLYDLMLPHAEEVVTSQATWVGPAAHDLGLLAGTLGRYDEADRHFAAAAELEMRMGSRAILVHTQLEWAKALQNRGQPGDDKRVTELLEHALEGARELELTGTEARISALME